MSKAFRAITREEFDYLLDFARRIHQDKNEPIPELGKENWEKVLFALAAPFLTGYGEPIYRTFLRKASVLFYMFAKGHRLSNGNKRMACVSLDYFCIINDRNLVITNENLVELARYTAKSDPEEMDECIHNIAVILKKSIQKNKH